MPKSGFLDPWDVFPEEDHCDEPCLVVMVFVNDTDYPEQDAILRQLRKDMRKMSANMDRLNAAVADNGAKADAIIAKLGTGGPGPVDPEGATAAEVIAAAEAVEVTNVKLGVAIAA